MPGMTDITVLKRGLNGEVTWQYEGRVLKRESNRVVLEAFFNRDDTPFMGVVLKRGDRFVETFYMDRWYNVFEIFDRDDGKFKGWYCNIGYPAVLERDTVSYIDLALDLWVAADGTQTVLDEDEFLALPINVTTRAQAISALEELKQHIANEKPPA
jgi:predicted RNA-binding protein associated with RNAse of E/G family